MFAADPFALFEDALAAPGEQNVLALRELVRVIEAGAGDDPAAVLGEIAAEAARGHWVALAIDYEFGYRLEPRAGIVPLDRPLLRAAVFARGERSAGRRDLGPGFDGEGPAGVLDLAPTLDAAAHARAVASILGYIAAGDCYQVNFTFPFAFTAFGDPRALYARLAAAQPVRYGACLALPGTSIVSLSPELFVEKTGNRLTTRPMKGTARRGASREEDDELRRRLETSAKDRAENIMIVDLLRNDLGRIAATGTVRVEDLCAIEAYPTLWQMVSTVVAEAPGAGLFDVLRALFPCGSITGAPKIRAMQIAAELEAGRRGLYTGAIGWLAPGGDFRLSVGIRTLEIAEDGRGRLGVGSGIVHDSNAADEYAECLLKAKFVAAIDPGLRLIETLRLEVGAGGGVYPRLAGHLARLRASAHAFGFACDEARVAAALAKAAGRAPGLWRVRLELDPAGDVALSVSPIADELRPWRVDIAARRVASRDPLRRHKTTARAVFDAALAALPPDVFDCLFLNERDEVCEGARSNVFIRRGGRLLTPPLACGLLPGVLRGELLAAGHAEEAVIGVADLFAAEAIYCGNALRGLVPVTLGDAAR